MKAPRKVCLVVLGSSNTDLVVKCPRLPVAGETIAGGEFDQHAGGKGANQAVACARAGGVPTRFLTALGRDDFAKPLEASLAAANVEVVAIHPHGLPTGTAFICVSDSAENAITVAPGANLGLAAAHLPSLGGVGQLLMQLETPLATVEAFADAARAAGVVVTLNAAPGRPLPASLLSKIDVLIVNEGELALLAGPAGTLVERMRRLPVPVVVTTLGERGACALTPDGVVLQPSWPVEAVDTTGAGDTFCGVFVAGRAGGASIAIALRTASAAAALACTRPGAQSSVPAREEVERFLASRPPTPTAALAAWCGIEAA